MKRWQGGQLFGRDRHLSALAEALDQTDRGAMTATCVVGGIGTGKTAVLQDACTAARRRGFLVVTATVSRSAQNVDFSLARQLHNRMLGISNGGATDETDADGLPPWPIPSSSDEYGNALYRQRSLLAQWSRRAPVLIAIDDVQWADAESLWHLQDIGHHLAEHRVALIMTASPGETNHDVIDRLSGMPGLSQLRLGNLSQDSGRQLIADLCGRRVPVELAAACHEITGGNPLLLATLLPHVVEAAGEVPSLDRLVLPHLATNVLLRLGNQDTSMIALANAVAALGGGELELVAAAAGLPMASATRATTKLMSLGWLHDRPELVLTPPVVRSVIAARLDPSESRAIHARAARFLYRTLAPPRSVAQVLLKSQRLAEPWVVPLLRKAARDTARNGDEVAAITFLRRALDEPDVRAPRGELLTELGELEVHVAPSSAIRRLGEAADLTGDPRQRARIALAQAEALSVSGRCGAAVEMLERAIAEVGEHDTVLVSTLEAHLVSIGSLDHATASLVAARLADHRWPVAPQIERPLRMSLAFRASLTGPVSEVGGRMPAERPMRQVWTLEQLRAFDNAVTALINIDELEAAWGWCEEIIEEHSFRGLAHARAVAVALRAEINYRMGRLPAARDDIDTARGMLRHHDGSLSHRLRHTSVRTLIELGNAESAAAEIERYNEVADSPVPPHWHAHFLLDARGTVRTALGTREAALRDHLRCGKYLVARRVENPNLIPWRSRAALLHAELGDVPTAIRLAREELRLARHWGLARAVGIASRTVGMLTTGADGATLLADAAGTLADTSAELELAVARTELGSRLALLEKPEEANAEFQQALLIAETCGAVPLADRIKSELDTLRAGGRPDPGPVARDALTPQEDRIARLAVRGWSNVDIAKELHLTRRTIEFHLTNAYRKLGISRRGQLVTRFHQPVDRHDVGLAT